MASSGSTEPFCVEAVFEPFMFQALEGQGPSVLRTPFKVKRWRQYMFALSVLNPAFMQKVRVTRRLLLQHTRLRLVFGPIFSERYFGLYLRAASRHPGLVISEHESVAGIL